MVYKFGINKYANRWWKSINANGQVIDLTSGEVDQLENIGTSTVSSTQWVTLGGLTSNATELNLLDGIASLSTGTSDNDKIVSQGYVDDELSAHSGSTNNPHTVTAAQVGKDIAQWNADEIQGVTVDNTDIANGKILQYNSTSGNLEYETVSSGSSDFLSLTDTPSSYTTGSLLFTSGSAVTQDNTNLFWDDTGNKLGIGTTTPDTVLDIESIANGSALLSLKNGDTNVRSNTRSQIALGYNGTNTYQQAIVSRHSSIADAGNAIDFYLWDYGTDSSTTIGSNKVVSIDGSGLLEVAGQVKITGGIPGDGKVLTSDANGLATWETPATGGGGADADWTVSGDDMYSSLSGNVGIGTSTPTLFKLQVNGNIGPNTDDTYDLGSDAYRWKNIYVEDAGALHLGMSATDEGSIEFNNSVNQLEFDINGVNKMYLNSTGVTIPTLASTTANLTKTVAANGTVAAPSYTFTGDTDNGMYKVTTNSYGFASYGVNKMTVNTTGVTIPVLAVTSDLNMTNPFQMISGTVATPSYNFSSDPDTGMYRATTNSIGFASSGVNKMTVNTLGVTIPTLSSTTATITTANNTKTVAGYGTALLPSYTFTSDPNTGMYHPTTDQLGFSTGGLNRMTISSSGVSIPTLNVTTDLNLTNPLELSYGTALLPSYTFTSDPNTGMYRVTTDQLGFSTGGVNRMTMSSSGVSIPTLNVTTDLNLTNPLELSYGTALLPSYTFTSDTNTGMYHNATDQIGFASAGLNKMTVHAGGVTIPTLTATTINPTTAIRGTAGTVTAPVYSFTSDTNTGMYWITTDTLGFAAGGLEKMRIHDINGVTIPTLSSTDISTTDIDMTGNLAIGTTTPDEKFEIEFGSVYKDIEMGVGTTDPDVTFITLRSPNGTKYYITVDDAGTMTTSTTKP